MKSLQVTILCLLLSLYSSKEDTGVNAITGVLLSTRATEISVSTASIIPNPVLESTSGASPKGTTKKESLNSPLLPTLSSLTATIKDEGNPTKGVMKNEFTTANATVTNPPLSNSASTSQSSQHKTENQSSIKTTETPVNSLRPETLPSNASTLPSISITTPGNISQFQGTEDAKNASSSSASPSYSSIILPVVIALIVVTLSAFILVGLYRMCWKTDPGTPENGNDQPQSDKESVKLLTVKTISHESGEHSAQGKTKN
ncbi:endomucin isoform X1 [Panthera uncia]|uniref:endomucin isoform X1 n=1 Tax=Panthera uncia TaxID=29064 RepID=UPI0020FFED4D|nr:endomucin isoform X1 [Panthera uncia]XP_049486895.1 endomucin isoform X1 [Panthera uncia]